MRFLFLFIFLVIFLSEGFSQIPSNLPPVLTSNSGVQINNQYDWENIRRNEILKLFKDEVYGALPEDFNPDTRFSIAEESVYALGGMATRRQVVIELKDDESETPVSITMLIYLPNEIKQPVPVILGLNFYGNHTIHPDPAILISTSWVRNNHGFQIENNLADERSRGVRVSRWPVEYILSRGYGIATIYYGDIDPDFDDGFKNGLHSLFEKDFADSYPENGPGSIVAWAFGLSKALDYLQTDGNVDADKITVFGHSRLGKASLWAGAMDERFALVISNNSGCGGAALSMRKHGETVKAINDQFPHWFCDNFTKYNDNEESLPVDQHMLLALIAPRPLYVASAEEDDWADPYGEQLSTYLVSDVYDLFKKTCNVAMEQSIINFPVKTGYTGYHIRSGPHDVRGYDWEQYLDFMDLHFSKE